MKYKVDFQKEYKTSEQISETIYIVVVDHNHYHNRPFIFTREVHPSSYTDVKGMVEEWNCGSYYTREFQAEVTIDDAGTSSVQIVISLYSVYDMQKPKIKNTSAKVEAKATKNINEISLTIKAKDESSLLEVIDILNMVQIYFTVSVSEKDNFFDPNSKDKNISYYEKLYGIVSCNHYKYDDNSTTIRVVGKKDNVNFFKQTIEQY